MGTPPSRIAEIIPLFNLECKETLRLCVFTFVTFYGKIRDTYPYAGRKPQNSAALHERNLMEYVPRLHPGDY